MKSILEFLIKQHIKSNKELSILKDNISKYQNFLSLLVWPGVEDSTEARKLTLDYIKELYGEVNKLTFKEFHNIVWPEFNKTINKKYDDIKFNHMKKYKDDYEGIDNFIKSETPWMFVFFIKYIYEINH